MKANIPPFYVGQKVVYIGWATKLKNTIHTVESIYKVDCGCWIVKSSSLPYGHYDVCAIGHRCLTTGNIGNSTSFRPLQEATAPLMTFKEIVEVEKEEILIMN